MTYSLTYSRAKSIKTRIETDTYSRYNQVRSKIQEGHPLKQGLSVCLLKTPQKASFSFHALRSNLTVPPLSSSLFQRAPGHAPVRLPADPASCEPAASSWKCQFRR